MKFIDEATIKIFAGDGGNGIASFRREKYEPMGGPNGRKSQLQNQLKLLRKEKIKLSLRQVSP